MARMGLILGGAILLALAGCADDEPERDDSGKPFPGVDRNYRVFPKNPQVVEAPAGRSPSCDPNASGEAMVRINPLGPDSGDANLIVEQYRRYLLEARPGDSDFSLRIGGAIILDAGAGWARTTGRVTVEATAGNVTGKLEVGASR
jgi:hypothetical protein